MGFVVDRVTLKPVSQGSSGLACQFHHTTALVHDHTSSTLYEVSQSLTGVFK